MNVNIKINGKKDWTQSEMFKIIHCYELTPEEAMDIFFNERDWLGLNDEK